MSRAMMSHVWPVDISLQMHPSRCTFDRAARDAVSEARRILSVTEPDFARYSGRGPRLDIPAENALAESLAAFLEVR